MAKSKKKDALTRTNNTKPVSAWEAQSFQRQRFIDLYIQLGQATSAAVGAGYSEKSAAAIGSRILKESEVQAALSERLAHLQLDATTVRARLAEIASADADDFISFRIVREQNKEWMPVAEAAASMERLVDVDDRYEDLMRDAEEELTETEKIEIKQRRRELIRLQVQAEAYPDSVAMGYGPVVEREEPYVDLAKMKKAGKLHLVKKIKRDKDGSMSVELHDRQSTLHHLDKMHEAARLADVERGRQQGSEQLAGALGKMGLTLNQVNVTNINLG